MLYEEILKSKGIERRIISYEEDCLYRDFGGSGSIVGMQENPNSGQ